MSRVSLKETTTTSDMCQFYLTTMNAAGGNGRDFFEEIPRQERLAHLQGPDQRVEIETQRKAAAAILPVLHSCVRHVPTWDQPLLLCESAVETCSPRRKAACRECERSFAEQVVDQNSTELSVLH